VNDEKNRFQAVLFDMDGVLALTEPVHMLAWRRCLEGVSLPGWFTLENLAGLTDLEMAERLKRERLVTGTAEQLVCWKKKIFIELVGSEGIACPDGRDEFLDYCSGLTVGVVSSSSVGEIEAILRSQGIRERFSFVVADRDTAKHKPDPEPYRLALRKAGCGPEHALAIEDSPPGIAAAVRAGIATVALTTSFKTLDDLGQAATCADFLEIKRWMEESKKVN
jgi:phosphoglycolate phosphatase